MGDCISWRLLVWSRSAIALSDGLWEILKLEWQDKMAGVFESSDGSIGFLRLWNLEGIWGGLEV